MSTTYFYDWQRDLEIPGRVTLLEGNGGLPKIEIVTPQATAELYVQGAHLTAYQKRNEAPLLFLSQVSRFESGVPIRGGIPIVYPWFGARDGQSSHGFARVHDWELWEIITLANGSVRIQLRLPESPESSLYPPANVNYSITVGESISCKLTVTNRSDDQSLEFEDCLHSYFLVGDIDDVTVSGLQGLDYVDKVDDFSLHRQEEPLISIREETDRVYLDAPGPLEIIDRSLERVIRLETVGAHSAVVWNPWIEKSQRLPDFGVDEYRRMLCVESGNIARNQVRLAPGESSALRVKLSTRTPPSQ